MGVGDKIGNKGAELKGEVKEAAGEATGDDDQLNWMGWMYRSGAGLGP